MSTAFFASGLLWKVSSKLLRPMLFCTVCAFILNRVPNLILLLGFDWKGLKQDAVVVDVGGGIGSQSMTLAQNHSHLRLVVQDREPVVKDAIQVCSLSRLNLAIA